MKQEEADVDRQQAAEALATIDNMKRSASRRATPSVWFGVAISVVVGCLVATPVLGDRDTVTVLLILALAAIIDQQRRRSGASPAFLSNIGPKTVAALILVILVFLGLVAGGIVLRDSFDLAWGPVAAGAVAAVAVFLLSESDRRSQPG